MPPSGKCLPGGAVVGRARREAMQVERPEIAAELAHRPDAVAKTEAVTILVFYFPFVDYRVPPIAAVAGDPGAGIAAMTMPKLVTRNWRTLG